VVIVPHLLKEEALISINGFKQTLNLYNEVNNYATTVNTGGPHNMSSANRPGDIIKRCGRSREKAYSLVL
jgi:hypothetical protein